MELSCLKKTQENSLKISGPKKRNETPLGETECLSNLYYLLAGQASNFLIHSQLGHIWYPQNCSLKKYIFKNPFSKLFSLKTFFMRILRIIRRKKLVKCYSS